MNVTFDEWRRQLGAAGLLLNAIPPAFNGLKWSQPLEIEGNFTTAAIDGSVSLEPNGAPIATLAFSGASYTGGWTSWMVSLAAGTGANSTGAVFAGHDGDGDGVVTCAIMFRITPVAGDKAVLRGGVLTVLEQA